MATMAKWYGCQSKGEEPMLSDFFEKEHYGHKVCQRCGVARKSTIKRWCGETLCDECDAARSAQCDDQTDLYQERPPVAEAVCDEEYDDED